jgi:pantetheine-phosphate adenylyltransferase
MALNSKKYIMKKVIYPGSFDPVTNGHVDIIKRALTIFDHLIIAISNNQDKSPVFSLEERQELIKKMFPHDPRVEVVVFDGLLVNFAKKKQTHIVLRGLRSASDFEYESQLASMNQNLDENFETIFMMASSDTYFLSSRLVKEIAFLGGNVEKLVPKHVVIAFKKKRSKV